MKTGILTRIAVPLVLFGAVSCARRAQPAPQTTMTPPALPQPPRVRNGASLGERLAYEVNDRPAGAPRAEQVANALAQAGVSVAPLKQVLAHTVGARYCATTTTGAGLSLAVCEFANAADAAHGLAYSHQTFDKLIPGRTLTRNQATVLTVTPARPSPQADAEVGRTLAVFAAL